MKAPKAPKTPLVGDLIRSGLITREDVLDLVGQIFDGRRTLPVGKGGCQIVLQRHGGLTKHLQECLTTVLLTSPGLAPAGSAIDMPEAADEPGSETASDDALAA